MRQTVFLSLISLIFLVGIFPLLTSAIAQSSDVPDWVKNNAQWWAEGKISEQEYLNAIQFLVDEGIIKLKSSEETMTVASSSVATDNDRVQYYVVTISSGDFVDEHTFTTFSSKSPVTKKLGFDSYLRLESLPSKDKTELYKFLSRYMNPGPLPQPIDIKIDLISGDGTIIFTENYGKCEATGFSTYTQDWFIMFSYSKKQQAEIRESIDFKCGGVKLIVYDPDKPKTYDISSLNPIPNDNDRGLSFVTHFFDGDLKQVHSSKTFQRFSPSVDKIETDFFTVTAPGNPFDESPQFFLESLPSKDRQGYYKFLSRYINPVKTPEPFDVSVDLITGDGTILLRGNYVDCNLNNFEMKLQDSKLRYSITGQKASEVKDKADFGCAGQHLLVHGFDEIDIVPIKDINFQASTPDFTTLESIPRDADRAQSYVIHFFNGEFEQTHTSDAFPKFRSISWEDPLTPVNQQKKYNFGFIIESLPSKDKKELYDFLSRYVNPGKKPELFDVNIDVLTGDGTILQTLEYTGCEAVDLEVFLEQKSWIYSYSGKNQAELREKYSFFCDGHLVNVP